MKKKKEGGKQWEIKKMRQGRDNKKKGFQLKRCVV